MFTSKICKDLWHYEDQLSSSAIHPHLRVTQRSFAHVKQMLLHPMSAGCQWSNPKRPLPLLLEDRAQLSTTAASWERFHGVSASPIASDAALAFSAPCLAHCEAVRRAARFGQQWITKDTLSHFVTYRIVWRTLEPKKYVPSMENSKQPMVGIHWDATRRWFLSSLRRWTVHFSRSEIETVYQSFDSEK